MGKVIIEQFNPKTKCWNKLSEIDEMDYDENTPVVNRYDGPYRTKFIGCNLKTDNAIIAEEIVEAIDDDLDEDVTEEKSYSWE